MSHLLNISEIAKYAGVSRRTLIYYDEIDLFKPIKIGKNGYRYYSFRQCEEIDVILILKELNMPLKEIKAFLKNRTPENSKEEFLKQRDKVNIQIKKLEKTRDTLDRFLFRYEKLANLDLEKLTLVEKEKEYFVASDMIYNMDDMSIYNVYSSFYSYVNPRDLVSGHPLGFLIEEKEFTSKEFHLAPYRMLVKIDKETTKNYKNHTIIEKPAGLYLTGFFNDGIHQMDTLRNRFTEVLKIKNLKIDGDIFETMWQDETSTAHRNEHIYEISIPVKKL